MTAAPIAASERCGWPAAILFDLDGTLIWSAPDIRTAINLVLASEGKLGLSLNEVQSMVGNGVRKLVERAFAARDVNLNTPSLDVMHARMMEAYGAHLTHETTLRKGAEQILRAYGDAGVKLAIVTNKPEALTHRILRHFALDNVVHAVVGGDTCATRKPDPEMLRHAVALLGVSSASRAVMIGDSAADINAARAAGMHAIAVRGGYTNVPADELGAAITIDTLCALPQAIEALKSDR